MAGTAEGVEGQELARPAELGLERLQPDPRLHRHRQVVGAELDHPVQAAGLQGEVEAVGRVAHAEGSAAADGDDRETVAGGLGQGPGKVLRRRRAGPGAGLDAVYHHRASAATPVRATSLGSLWSGSGKILPGFSSPWGSSTSLTRCITWRSSGL